LRAAVDNLESNGAYMVMTALASIWGADETAMRSP